MIVKFDLVQGHALAELMKFIYGNENKCGMHDRVVILKEASQKPQSTSGYSMADRNDPYYGITLEVNHMLDGKTVDPKYLTQAYQILTAKVRT